eukprot:CAMPEP_0195102000 /NCGR_PEP_ID=MMETSP0448-20130528/65581_1 /TAXON_ID=66468 /ORGANISM="Heterocapsa triquestra, Strain CCMP 448" /LENGTH=54 /DNA_ID=CAMNT_0040137409 /DNA_START=46 /DNA_END=210 /DNA_ORIENTATION=-
MTAWCPTICAAPKVLARRCWSPVQVTKVQVGPLNRAEPSWRLAICEMAHQGSCL